jgi:hypothetical protein
MSVTSILNTGYTPILAGLIEQCVDARGRQVRVSFPWRRSRRLTVIAVGPVEAIDPIGSVDVVNQCERRQSDPDRAIDINRKDC